VLVAQLRRKRPPCDLDRDWAQIVEQRAHARVTARGEAHVVDRGHRPAPDHDRNLAVGLDPELETEADAEFCP